VLKDIKSNVDDDAIRELIGYSVFPDPDALERAIEGYKSDPTLQLFGYESEDEIVGVIGLSMDDESKKLAIHHLAVKPECRGAGFGRGMILEAIAPLRPNVVVAETDEEAVQFYRWIGFEIESLGESYPGVERFRCTYDTQDADGE